MSLPFYYPIATATLHVVFDGFGDTAKDTPQQLIDILPKAVTVHRNSYHQADSFELTFDANDLPIDPQLIRNGSVEIYLFQQPADHHSQRVLSREYATSDDPANISGTDALDNLRRETLRTVHLAGDNPPTIVGLFDEDDIEFSGDGKEITISGQDYTALLAAKQWPPTAAQTARKIPVGQRLDRQIAGILAEADDQHVLRLQVRNIDPEDLPIVGAKETAANKRGIPVDESTSYWDVMYKLAIRHSCILFVQGLDVVLTRPKNLEAASAANAKKLAWGRNLESLRLTRRFGKEKVPRIILQAYDKKTRETIIAEYPNTGLGKHVSSKIGQVGFKPSSKATSIEKQSNAGQHRKPLKAAPLKLEDEYQIIPITETCDKEILLRMAETLYQLRGHAERKLVAVTRDLRDMRESSLLDLNVGDPVEVDWDDFNREMIANPNVPTQAKQQYLVSRGFNVDVAQIIAESYQVLLSQKRPMRVREVSYEYDADDGIRIEVELQDFVVPAGNRDGGVRPTVESMGVP